jgi:HEAT repeat protein
MKKCLVLLFALTGSLAGSQTTLSAADANDEQALIQVLQSTTAGPREKDAACARLKFIGTSRCVPSLATLLTDEQLSHSARYALEPMRFDEAGAALLDALPKTKGLLRVGIINSLAARQETRAVPALVELLNDSETGTASASARALGQIGGSDAVKALLASARSSTAELHEAAVDGLLRCANHLLSSGQPSGALAIFEQLDGSSENELIRVAAFRGRVQASGNAGLNLVLHAISGPTGPSQMAALQLVRDLQVPNSSTELAKLLPDLEPAVQISLVEGLAQRGDPSALPALAALAANAQSQLRLALIQAFDELGDASVVPLLAGFAASGSAGQQKAARLVLADLRRGDVTQALIEQLSAASPEVQAELARALGARGDKAAVPKLLDSAQHGPASARKGVLQALSVLVDNSQLGALVDLVLQAKEPAGRAEAAEALNSACQHILIQQGHADATPLVQGFEKGSTEARAALLPICGGFVDPKIRATLRIALHDQDAPVHSAAIRAICDTTDPELLPDLLELARLTKEDSVRSLAIDGGVRLVTQEETVKLPPSRRVAALKALLACASRPEQKRMVLAGFGDVPDVKALGVVDTELDDSAVRNEAARAAVKIATALAGSDAQKCELTLKKALGAADDAGTRQAVQAALKQLQETYDYLTNWQVAGPYRQADKDYAALFDVAFPPENKNSQDVKWQALPAGTDPKRPWVMDLLKALGGQECVAYARTWVHSDQEHGAVLELGSDDGVKVWLNDKQVYALNVARALQPGSDKVNVTLHPGWNPLLFKITQNNQGWEFCARFRNADGSHLDDIRCDSAPQTASARP